MGSFIAITYNILILKLELPKSTMISYNLVLTTKYLNICALYSTYAKYEGYNNTNTDIYFGSNIDKYYSQTLFQYHLIINILAQGVRDFDLKNVHMFNIT